MNYTLWFGDTAGHAGYEAAQSQAAAKLLSGQPAPQADLLSVQGTVGVINVSGSLVSGSAGFMSFFGYTGYSDIRDALVAAISNQDVTSILLNVQSGGGAVDGVQELASLLSRVDAVKPVITYTGGLMASAALWLGASARKIVAAPTAQVGSVGVLMMHADRSDQLAQAGVKVTVIRAGEDKALMNAYEPLSDKALAQAQDGADYMHTLFKEHMMQSRGASKGNMSKFSTGKMFIGQQAKDVGLADMVGFYEDAYAMAVKAGAQVKKKSGYPVGKKQQSMGPKADANIAHVSAEHLAGAPSVLDNPANPEGTPMLQYLSQEQLIAMAAGVSLEQAEAVAEGRADAAPAADVAPAADPQAEALAAMSADLLSSQETLAAVSADLAAAKASAEAASAVTARLASIVHGSVRTMAIALGETAPDATAAAEALADAHATLAEKFKSKFKVGAVAATNTLAGEGKKVSAPVAPSRPDPLFIAAALTLK